jgi:hypothetical protein
MLGSVRSPPEVGQKTFPYFFIFPEIFSGLGLLIQIKLKSHKKAKKNKKISYKAI